MGKPVAFDASAELRDTLGFISMTIIRPVAGSTANWMLLPPVSTPTASMTMRGPIAHLLVLDVGERLRGRDGDGVARMYPHRIEVLDRADDGEVRRRVAHHFELELFPPEERLLHQDTAHRGKAQSVLHELDELFAVVGDAAAGAAEGERRPQDRGITDGLDEIERFVQASHVAASGDVETRGLHRFFEPLTNFGELDRFDARADETNAEFFENARSFELDREVQPRLPAHGGEDRIRLLLLEDGHDVIERQRLDVGRVGELEVGHDRGRVRVDQDDAHALFPQDLDRLRAGVVELGRLADHDRSRAEDENTFNVGIARHQAVIISRKRSKR